MNLNFYTWTNSYKLHVRQKKMIFLGQFQEKKITGKTEQKISTVARYIFIMFHYDWHTHTLGDHRTWVEDVMWPTSEMSHCVSITSDCNDLNSGGAQRLWTHVSGWLVSCDIIASNSKIKSSFGICYFLSAHIFWFR